MELIEYLNRATVAELRSRLRGLRLFSQIASLRSATSAMQNVGRNLLEV